MQARLKEADERVRIWVDDKLVLDQARPAACL
jgi:hypothetical protein